MLSVGRFICLKALPAPHRSRWGSAAAWSGGLCSAVTASPPRVTPQQFGVLPGPCAAPPPPPALGGRRLLLSLKEQQRIFIYF